MRYFALACDYDGTIASAGVVSRSTIEVLRRVAESGRRLILVTGRELPDLQRVFPELAVFHRVVAENGALLFRPGTNESKTLAPPPPSEFVEALQRLGVTPLSVGSSIVATVEPHDVTVLEVIRDLGLELQVIYNKGSVMVLPTGVNKATGLLAALEELGLSEHNAVAVGDAENDHALLRTAECGVAVASAVALLKEHADMVTRKPNGSGVEELAEQLLADDLRNVELPSDRSKIVLGTTASAEAVSIPCYGSNLVIAGPSGSGKTTIVHALVERLLEANYQVCLVDPEGDYEQIENVIPFGTSSRTPDLTEISAALQTPKTSISVNLLSLPLADRPAFFAALLAKALELRAKSGRPHWLIVDEAHHLLPATWEPAKDTIPHTLTGVIMTTVHPDSLAQAALKATRGIIAVGPTPQETVERFSRAIGVPPPSACPSSNRQSNVCVWFVGSEHPASIRIDPPKGKKQRHKRKYASGDLGVERSFVFKGPDHKLNLRAQNLMIFNQIAEGVDEDTWLYHLQRGDYSQWISEAIKDDELAAEVKAVETARGVTAQQSRGKITDLINRRYTGSE
jgi:hydroxymethylpyrimidine pyrophosphatase-like HAD family hydrolase